MNVESAAINVATANNLDDAAWQLALFVASKAGLNGSPSLHYKVITTWLAAYWDDAVAREVAVKSFVNRADTLSPARARAGLFNTILTRDEALGNPRRMKELIDTEKNKRGAAARHKAFQEKAKALGASDPGTEAERRAFFKKLTDKWAVDKEQGHEQA